MKFEININTVLLAIILLLLVFLIARTFLNTLLIKTIKMFGAKQGAMELKQSLKGEAIDLIKEFGIIIVDVDGRIKLFNVGAEAIFEYQEKEVLGSNITVIIPEKYKARHIAGMKRLREMGKDAVLKNTIFELEGERKSGKTFPIRLTLCQTKHQEGHQLETYYTAFIEDTSAAIRIKNERDRELQLYKVGEYIGGYGTWQWDLVNDKVYTSENFDEIFDWHGAEANAKTFLSRVVEADVSRVWAVLDGAMQRGEDYEITYTIVGKNNKSMQVFCIGRCAKSEYGIPIQLTGIMQVLDETSSRNFRT